MLGGPKLAKRDRSLLSRVAGFHLRSLVGTRIRLIATLRTRLAEKVWKGDESRVQVILYDSEIRQSKKFEGRVRERRHNWHSTRGAAFTQEKHQYSRTKDRRTSSPWHAQNRRSEPPPSPQTVSKSRLLQQLSSTRS